MISKVRAFAARVASRSPTAWAAVGFGFALVALQRFGIQIPFGSVQFSTIVSLSLCVWALLVAHIRWSRQGLALLSALLAVGIASALLSESPSIPSLVLLIATYALVVLHRRDQRELGSLLFLGALAAIKVGAVIAILQFVWQRLGNGYFDPLQLLPTWLIRSDFNSYYDLQYAGGEKGEFKPNGAIFLEPSFVSLYCAIGLIYLLSCIFDRDRSYLVSNAIWVGILGVALATSASTSGLLVLAAGAVPLLFRVHRNLPALALIVAGLGIMWIAGLLGPIIAKSQESLISADSSSALRLVLPYQYLAPSWLESPFIGHGPGAATTIVSDLNVLGLQTSTMMKALVEYGLLGAVIVVLIVVRSVWGTRAPLPVVFGLLAAWLLPSEALLNPVIVALIIFSLGQWPRPSPAEVGSQQGPIPGRSAGAQNEESSRSDS